MPPRFIRPVVRPIAWAVQACLMTLSGHVWAEEAVPSVDIIGTAPLPGQGVDRAALPYTTHVLRRADLDAAQALNLSELLAQQVPGVQINDIQGSPFQGDVSYHGHRASGLLGAAQGLSVYLDGVRINEPFGDVVNWDMVPEFALQSVSLVPGANPAFGLNTLGGALALRTASGVTAPGSRVEASVGRFGRQQLSLSHGGSNEDGWHHYVALSGFQEDGWRDHSAGQLGTVFAKLGRAFAHDEFTLSLLAGRSRLVGNGLIPLDTFDEDGRRQPDLGANQRSAVYTHPDETRNRMLQLSAEWRHDMDARTRLEALAWYRHSDRHTVNGDLADDEEEGGGGTEADEPAARASLNRTATRQHAVGVSVGVSGRQAAHQWQVGVTWDQSRTHYDQTEQAGELDATRGVYALDAPVEPSARVAGRQQNVGLYAGDTWALTPRTHLTGGLRWQHASVSNQLSTADEDSGSLAAQPRERFDYRSVNPALGLSHRFEAGWTLFGQWARNTRVPTVIELGCADPDQPCRLPAGLQSDPYLRPVRATTTEVGMRFGPLSASAQGWRGAVSVFRNDNRDDILFRSVSVNGQLGYFQNFALTRYQGWDWSLGHRAAQWDTRLAYSQLHASYQAHGVLRMGDRNVTIRPGTEMAGVPRHTLKASVDWLGWASWRLGLDVQAFSRRGVNGNEDGRLSDDATASQRLSLPGYALLHARASWHPAPMVEVFGGVRNLLNRTYASFGTLAATHFDAQGQWSDEERDALFVAPGAPRSVTLGVRWQF